MITCKNRINYVTAHYFILIDKRVFMLPKIAYFSIGM